MGIVDVDVSFDQHIKTHINRECVPEVSNKWLLVCPERMAMSLLCEGVLPAFVQYHSLRTCNGREQEEFTRKFYREGKIHLLTSVT